MQASPRTRYRGSRIDRGSTRPGPGLELRQQVQGSTISCKDRQPCSYPVVYSTSTYSSSGYGTAYKRPDERAGCHSAVERLPVPALAAATSPLVAEGVGFGEPCSAGARLLVPTGCCFSPGGPPVVWVGARTLVGMAATPLSAPRTHFAPVPPPPPPPACRTVNRALRAPILAAHLHTRTTLQCERRQELRRRRLPGDSGEQPIPSHPAPRAARGINSAR